MGAKTDKAFEVPTAGIIINEGGGVYSQGPGDSGNPWVDAPDAPVPTLFLRSDGTAYWKTQSTGSGIQEDWVAVNFESISGGASIQLSWKFSTTTTAADPGTARLRFDNATPASVTEIYVDDVTNNGFDVSNIFNNLTTGGQWYIQEAGVAGAFLLVTIDSVTDNTGWFTIGVTVLASGTLPGNNRNLGTVLIGGGGGGIPIQDEGSPITNTPHSTLNFTGAGVSATDGGSGVATINIPGITPADMAAVQARRTTNFAFPGSWADVTFGATDFENDAAVVEHDNTNTDRITLKEAGAYLVMYRIHPDIVPDGGNAHTFVRARVTVNDGGTDLPGSFSEIDIGEDSSLVGDATWAGSLHGQFVYDATANDFLTLQIEKTNTSGSNTINAPANRTMITVVRLAGPAGPQGAQGTPGAGSTIIVEDEGTPLTTAAENLDFVGAGVTASGSGTTKTITIPGAGSTTLEGAVVEHDADQTTSDTTDFLVAFNNETFDPDGMHDNATNNSRLTIPTGAGGSWLFGFNARWENNSSGWRRVSLRKNGTTIVGREHTTPGINVEFHQCVTFPMQVCAAGDFFEIVVHQNSGGTLDLEVAGTPPPTFWAQRVA